MSYLGAPQPFEDDTAASLVRREGFPPIGSYNQMPEVHDCVCCKAINPMGEGSSMLRTMKDDKEREYRKTMQWDVYDERAKPQNPTLPRGGRPRNGASRNAATVTNEDLMANMKPTVPPPPPTVNDLMRNKASQQGSELNGESKLVVTILYGKNIQTGPKDPLSVVVRCGAFEGQTVKVPRGKSSRCTWDELFEFPYSNPNEPLEVLVINDALPEESDHFFGGSVIPANLLNDRDRGHEEDVPVLPESEMQNGLTKGHESSLGTIVMSWYISDGARSVQEPTDLNEAERQDLEEPTACTFAVHRIFQYTDNGSEAYPGGVLCVLRDTEDNFSESILFEPGSERGINSTGEMEHEGYHYLPENPSQVLQLTTNKKLGHILVCIPKETAEDEEDGQDAEEELIVIGAVPLDYERLYTRGTAVLLVESKSKDDALWGEISVEWINRGQHEEEAAQRALLEAADDDAAEKEGAREDGEAGSNGRGLQDVNDEDSEDEAEKPETHSIYVTVVRGLNLMDSEQRPLELAYVVVATGDMEGATVEAVNELEEDNVHSVMWNQEVRFIDVSADNNILSVTVKEDDNVISVGECEVTDEEGVCIVKMHPVEDPDTDLGEITITYKKIHSNSGEDGAEEAQSDLENYDEEENAGDAGSDEYHESDVYAAENEDDQRMARNMDDDDEGRDGRDGEDHSGEDGEGRDGRDGEDHSGEDGEGRDGRDGEDHSGEDGEGRDGRDGEDHSGEDGEGRDGRDGEDHYGEDGEGRDGQDGQGRDGEDGEGHDGQDGEGHDGQDGEGLDGEDGEGRDGQDGQGRDGEDGEGRDGRDGEDHYGDDGEGRDGDDGEGRDGEDGEGRDGQDGQGRDGDDGEGRDGRDGEGLDGDDGEGRDGDDGEGRDGQDGQGRDGDDGEGRDGRDGEGLDGDDGEGRDGDDGEGRDGQDGQGRDGDDGEGRDSDDGEGRDGDDGEGRDGDDGEGRDGRDGEGLDGDDGEGRDGDDGEGRDGQDGQGRDGDDGEGRDGQDGEDHYGDDGEGRDGDDGEGRDGQDGEGLDGDDGEGRDGDDGEGRDGQDGEGHEGGDGGDGEDGQGNEDVEEGSPQGGSDREGGAAMGEEPFSSKSNAGGDEAAMGVSPTKAKRPQPYKRPSQEFRQPWYPAGNPTSERHMPFEERESHRKQMDSIRELERQSRIAEESVRRASVQRTTRSSVEGWSPTRGGSSVPRRPSGR